jgi:hypothetical protein
LHARPPRHLLSLVNAERSGKGLSSGGAARTCEVAPCCSQVGGAHGCALRARAPPARRRRVRRASEASASRASLACAHAPWTTAAW